MVCVAWCYSARDIDNPSPICPTVSTSGAPRRVLTRTSSAQLPFYSQLSLHIQLRTPHAKMADTTAAEDREVRKALKL